MIVFDLSALADDSHRRHFIDPNSNEDVIFDSSLNNYVGGWVYKDRWFIDDPINGEIPAAPSRVRFIPDYAAYYAACDQDKEIQSTVSLFHDMHRCENKVQIWTHQSESNRENISYWLVDKMRTDYCTRFCTSRDLKMRPIGDDRPTHELFEGWIDEMIQKSIQDCMDYKKHQHRGINDIQMVFSADPDVVNMFRRRGVFTFDCRQEIE